MATQTILPYTRRKLVATTRENSARAQERAFLWNAVMLECSVLSLLSFVHAVFIGIGFFTKFRDGSLYSSMERLPGTGEILFPLLPRLVDLTSMVGVEDSFRKTRFQAEHAHELLDHIGKMSWQRTSKPI